MVWKNVRVESPIGEFTEPEDTTVQPKLSIEKVGNRVLISALIEGGASWELQSSLLRDGLNWQSVSEASRENRGVVTFEMSTEGASKYFRLIKY